MPTLKLPKRLASELADIDAPCNDFYGDDPADGWEPQARGITEVVENRATGRKKRWTEWHELVIRTKDMGLWRVEYEVGLTESQYMSAFENDSREEIEFVQVKPHPVSHIEYQPA